MAQVGPAGSGSGTKLSTVGISLAGIASLIATVISLISIWVQFKNYRKPLLQRYVVRILLMVPIYALSSWLALVSLKAAEIVDPIRDIYEAFTIYTFFQLLINFLGGERALIIMMHGRAPHEHVWPLNYIFPKVDISDPHSFLAIKRGILQYAWLKPILALASVVMKATKTYQEGYIGLTSGYFWSGIIYNISVTVSLYYLGMFWVCMHRDLQPFRPVPKFLCVKLIIFASYWQGFFLSILVWLGVIHDVGYYTPDNVARAIQDVLICFELPAFAIAHWYAFSWRDYADRSISAARLPVYYAARDAFGIRDLIEDSKQTFAGKSYQYRLFDPGDNVMTHPDSDTRVARMMEGMRYERGGKGKYWIPKPTARTGLLSGPGPSDMTRPISPGQAQYGEARAWTGGNYGALEETEVDREDETLYETARGLEFGDYNYPVITANRPGWSHRCSYPDSPSVAAGGLITASTNQALLHHRPSAPQHSSSSVPQYVPTPEPTVVKSKNKHKKKSKSRTRNPLAALTHLTQQTAPLLSRGDSSDSSESAASHRSGLVDLVVENTAAEETERVRARKEGGPAWNEAEPKVFVRQYPPEHAGEEVRVGYEPPLSAPPVDGPSEAHATQGAPEGRGGFEVGEDEEENDDAEPERGALLGRGMLEGMGMESPWREEVEGDGDEGGDGDDRERTGWTQGYGSLHESGVWGR